MNYFDFFHVNQNIVVYKKEKNTYYRRTKLNSLELGWKTEQKRKWAIVIKYYSS